MEVLSCLMFLILFLCFLKKDYLTISIIMLRYNGCAYLHLRRVCLCRGFQCSRLNMRGLVVRLVPRTCFITLMLFNYFIIHFAYVRNIIYIYIANINVYN